MNIIAINGSPRGKNGNTYRMLDAIREGVQNASANMEIINLSDINMQMCIGCFRCWDKKDSKEIKCVLNDDIESVFRKMLNADLWIFGSPVYYDNISAHMKIFMERMVMLNNPDIRRYEDKYVHDIEFDIPPIVMLASCDLPGSYNFNIISQYMKKVAINLKTELIEEIYQSEARLLTWPLEALQFLVSYQRKMWIEAGRELVIRGRLSNKLRTRLNALLIPVEEYLKGANNLAENTKIKAGKEEGDGYGGY